MASFRKSIAQRFSQIASKSRYSSAAASTHPANNPSLLHRLLGGGRAEETRHLRNFSFLQSQPVVQPALPPDRLSRPVDGRLAQQILALNPARLQLDGLVRHTPAEVEPSKEEELVTGRKIGSEEVKKVMRASRMEAARRHLRAAGKSCVEFKEFLRICCEAAGSEQGPKIAQSLDDSGDVVVLGDVVLLKPDEDGIKAKGLEDVAKAIENIIPQSLSYRNDLLYEELRQMEEKKTAIDRKAAVQVRRELWGGLGYLVLQTAAFMRVTFWELSWDVMEPICFYVTSIYFMAGYAFFLRTSKEPSFEGFFQSRFAAKQKRLLKAQSFDLDRYNELRQSHGQASALACKEFASPSFCNCIGRCH